MAQEKAVERWGQGGGSIPFTVCKGKYQPFKKIVSKEGIEWVQKYGCFRHSEKREKATKKFGVREGWESFDQWPRPASDAGLKRKEVKNPKPKKQKKFKLESKLTELTNPTLS